MKEIGKGRNYGDTMRKADKKNSMGGIVICSVKQAIQSVNATEGKSAWVQDIKNKLLQRGHIVR